MIPSHKIADYLLSLVNWLIDLVGLDRAPALQEVIYTVLVIVIAMALGWAIRKGLVWIIRKSLSVRRTEVARQLLQQRLFTRCSHMIPPLILLALIPFAFDTDPTTLSVIVKIVVVYALITTAIAINAVLQFVWGRYDERENTKNHPLRGVLNVAQGIVWIVVVIVAVSFVIDKSPAYLLTGLGAFAAALMLVFKDSILGFVAGIQLSQNDMLRVGDWIVVPSTIANGTVIDVTLTVVKVRNWDNTIVMLPPYTLVSTSFQNWRGMTDSGCRRIAREVYFDNKTIRPLAEGEAAKIAERLPLLKDFVAKGGPTVYNGGPDEVNGTLETNLGLFRAYMCLYLLNSPQIDHNARILIRLMQPVYYGTPVEIYCFTATTVWNEYEAIQSQIFEHIAAVAPMFGLDIYNYSNGSDIVIHEGEPQPTLERPDAQVIGPAGSQPTKND